ncbi:MAG: hypothetical protein WCS96_05425 [Victivallales bacterium]
MVKKRKYSAILGNLGNARDRICGGCKDNPSSLEMLRRTAKIEGLTGVELVGTWDIKPDNVGEMKTAHQNLRRRLIF